MRNWSFGALAKPRPAALGDKDAHEVELMWRG